MSKLLIIDGNSIANRAFYALPPLTNAQGLHTNAVYGFTTMLLKLIEEEQPTHFLVAFDAGKVVFRHEGYKDYKGGRAKTPPELSEQFPVIKELMDAFRIAKFELEGYEADDIIGTLTKQAEDEKLQVLVVTGDKDMLQLASEYVTVLLTRKGISEVERMNPDSIQEKYGLTPTQIIDLKGLMGDASDNIPGVPGVGEKTALKLLHEYASVEKVLESVAQMKGKLKENLETHADSARLSKELATIHRDVPFDLSLTQLEFHGYDADAMHQLFKRLEFKSLLEKLNLKASKSEAEADRTSAPAVEVKHIGTPDLAEVIDQLHHVQSLHVEVYGENPHQSQIVGLSLYTGEMAYALSFETLKAAEAAPIREWLADSDKPKRMYDAHKAHIALAWQQIPLRGVTFDALLAAYLLDPTESSVTLSALAEKYGAASLQEDDEVFGKGAKYRVPDSEVLLAHLGAKAVALAQLNQRLSEQLEEKEMHPLFYELELPLSTVLAEMELTGIRVDAEELKRYGVELGSKVESLIQSIYSLAGTEFNINSPKQLGEILFDKLGLPVLKKTKTGYSTDAEVLEKLAPYHEIVSSILDYRQLAKLQSTYIEGLLKEIKPETGRIHTYYRQTIAATGRLSSQFPNLQNIPIRLEEGRKIRKVFVPSKPEYYILAADYSQIELRVLAHISDDEGLKEAFMNDMDVHTKTAMDVFGVQPDQVDANMRRQAKAVNFGIVYGISDYGLSQNLNITRKEAAQFIEQYFAAFQGVRRYMDDIVQQARKDGYVTTLLQRRRYLPEIKASNFNLRSFAERTAMNTPIQGTAADIIKLAMVKLQERLLADGLKSKMLLQVHDELVFEVPEEELEVMRTIVPEVMESALPLSVPLKVDVNWGRDWYDAK